MNEENSVPFDCLLIVILRSGLVANLSLFEYIWPSRQCVDKWWDFDCEDWHGSVAYPWVSLLYLLIIIGTILGGLGLPNFSTVLHSRWKNKDSRGRSFLGHFYSFREYAQEKHFFNIVLWTADPKRNNIFYNGKSLVKKNPYCFFWKCLNRLLWMRKWSYFWHKTEYWWGSYLIE